MSELITALCVTRDRPERLKRAVADFLKQTYANKHMVIVADPRSDESWVGPFIEWLDGHPDVTFMMGTGCECVADLRNLSLQAAQSDLVATWDDDDHYHPGRLKAQYEKLVESKVSACFITDAVFYFEDTKEMFFNVFEVGGVTGSMLARKSGLAPYPSPAQVYAARGVFMGEKNSDAIIQLLLMKRGDYVQLDGACGLYVRTYHGKNLWARASIYDAACKSSFSTKRISKEADLIVERLKAFVPFEIPDCVTDGQGRKIPLNELKKGESS